MTYQLSDLWCMNYMNEWYIKYFYKYQYAPKIKYDIWRVQIEHYCEIFQTLTKQNIREFLHNLEKVKIRWCNIYEEAMHFTHECQLNEKPKKIKIPYILSHEINNQNMDQGNKEIKFQDRGNGYQGRGGFRGGYRDCYGIWRGLDQGRAYFYICLNEDHMYLDCLVKDIIDLK